MERFLIALSLTCFSCIIADQLHMPLAIGALPLIVFILKASLTRRALKKGSSNHGAGFRLSALTFAESKHINWQLLKTKLTLYLVRSRQVKSLRDRVHQLEQEKRELHQELHGLTELWLKTRSPARLDQRTSKEDIEERPQRKNVRSEHLFKSFFSEKFFATYGDPDLESHSNRDRDAE